MIWLVVGGGLVAVPLVSLVVLALVDADAVLGVRRRRAEERAAQRTTAR